MRLNERAGQLASEDSLLDVPALERAYYEDRPDPSVPGQRVAFGTSGHRGSAFRRSFNEYHIAAITQAICDYRGSARISGPLYLGKDTHALSGPAYQTALEVLIANDVRVFVDNSDGYTPTPAVSRAILAWNADGNADGNASGTADGIVITPSHNPPEDGGIKYNPPHGGPADTRITKEIEDRANELLADGLKHVSRVSYSRALVRSSATAYDFTGKYVSALPSAIDVDAIRYSDLRVGADPLGGASVAYWQAIADQLGVNVSVVNPSVDPTFRFIPLDWDGRVRTDCSSQYAMAALIAQRHNFDIATGNDADADRHGIVTPDAGLLDPNRYLTVAISYLCQHRDSWPTTSIGKTVVSSSIIDRIVAANGRALYEVPVGFKWFVQGLLSGDIAFAGEESAGASFLSRDGRAWTTDKDGILLALLASEITAVTGRTPSQYFADLADSVGSSWYARIDSPATPQLKAALSKLSPSQIGAVELAGKPITGKLTNAPGNGERIGGIKVISESGWFAARPSGTEDVYKLYTESFIGPEHLALIQEEAQEIIRAAIQG